MPIRQDLKVLTNDGKHSCTIEAIRSGTQWVWHKTHKLYGSSMEALIVGSLVLDTIALGSLPMKAAFALGAAYTVRRAWPVWKSLFGFESSPNNTSQPPQDTPLSSGPQRFPGLRVAAGTSWKKARQAYNWSMESIIIASLGIDAVAFGGLPLKAAFVLAAAYTVPHAVRAGKTLFGKDSSPSKPLSPATPAGSTPDLNR